MPDHIGLILIAAIGTFGLVLTNLQAGVKTQAGTAAAIGIDEPKRLSPQEIRDRGISFRAELDKAFNALRDSEKAGLANEFTAIAVPYISAAPALIPLVLFVG